MPLIHNVNDSEEEQQARIAFLKSLSRPVARIYLLPYHDLGLSKLASLNWDSNRMASFSPPSEERIQRIRAANPDVHYHKDNEVFAQLVADKTVHIIF